MFALVTIALFSFILECVAIGTILNGTWRLYAVAIVFALISTFVRNKYGTAVVNFCLHLKIFGRDNYRHYVSVLAV